MTEFQTKSGAKIQLSHEDQPWGFFTVIVNGEQVAVAMNSRSGWVTHKSSNPKLANIFQTTQRKYATAVAQALGLN